MPKRHTHEDEAGAESRHHKPGMAPAARRKVERSEGGKAREADALQHQAETLAPYLDDNPIERQTLTGGRDLGDLAERDDGRHERRDDAGDHGGLEPVALIEPHAD